MDPRGGGGGGICPRGSGDAHRPRRLGWPWHRALTRGVVGAAGDGALTAQLLFCVPAQHAFLADILPRRPGGAAARAGARVFIAEATASPPAVAGASHPLPGPRLPRLPARCWTLGRVPAAERTCLVTISAAVLLVQARVLRRRVPPRGFWEYLTLEKRAGSESRLFHKTQQNKSEELLIWGSAGDEEGTGLGLSFFFFSFLIYGLISLLRYYALVPVLLVFLVVGLVWFSNLACGVVQFSFKHSLLQVVLWGDNHSLNNW